MTVGSPGLALGSLFSYVLRTFLDDDQLNAWGWRVPFFFGVLGVAPALYLKKHGREHHVTELESVSADESPKRQVSVVAEAFGKGNRLALLATILVASLPAAAYYIGTLSFSCSRRPSPVPQFRS